MLLHHISMDEFSQVLDRCQRTVVIPFGAVEEHGSHLPLGTDTFHAEALAALAAEKAGVLAAPPVWYGLCRSTSRHPGTIGIRGTVLADLVKEIVRSMYGQGLRRFVMISGHAGGTHMASILNACDELLDELPESQFAVLSIIDLVKRLPAGLVEIPEDSHAGEVETSLMQHLRPELVDGTSPAEYPSFPKFILVRDKLRYWPGGVWGDPSRASEEKGRRILEEEAEILCEIIERIQRIEKDQ